MTVGANLAVGLRDPVMLLASGHAGSLACRQSAAEPGTQTALHRQANPETPRRYAELSAGVDLLLDELAQALRE